MRRISYIHQLPDWPRFTWDQAILAQPLAAVRHRQGRLIGRMEGFGFPLRNEAVLQTLTEDVLKSSEIEGEHLDLGQVRSSIARRLGMDIEVAPVDRDVDGIVEMMLDATQNYHQPLTTERLFGWHAAMFPTGRSGMTRIVVGDLRDDNSGPMQVVSGPIGRERIHFEAPAAARLESETIGFLDWFNDEPGGIDPVLKAAVAHLWFVTIHPFDDGNGRIARAVSDMALARSEQTAQRFYSMSAQIRQERQTYYNLLEATQRQGNLNITGWLTWFLACLGRALDRSEETLANVLRKARFWERHADTVFNMRQRAMLNRLLDGFEGKLTSSKWARLQKCSQDTASRDIEYLMQHGVLSRDAGGGRSTGYRLIDA